jgi:hypothetical protein
MPGDWDDFRLEFDLPPGLASDAGDEAAAVSRAIAAFQPYYGSSLFFEWDLRRDHPELTVPERDVVPLLGKANVWTPEDETPPAEGETCPRCRRSIGHGSRSFCPRCALSGHERKLAEQRAIAGTPPAETPEGRWDYVPRRPRAPVAPPLSGPRPPSRRERRAKQYGRATGE